MTKPENFPESNPEALAALDALWGAMRVQALREGKKTYHVYKTDGKATLVCHLDLEAIP